MSVIGLSDEERGALLRIARHAIQDAVLQDGSLAPLLEQTEVTEALRAPCGAFVTLKKPTEHEGRDVLQLRGCIGHMQSDAPLVETLAAVAPRAALEDPRFQPLAADELVEVVISVSVLSPLQRIYDHNEIVVGRHGVQLVHGLHQAVFLPQVAVEQGWDLQQLLDQLSVKAGLPPGFWGPAALFVFESENFGEA